MGKRKIDTKKKIENTASRDVTFSKRRKGMFHKARELSILCGAKVAVVAFSRANNVFTFGHPNVDELINHYRHGTRPQFSADPITNEAPNSIHVTKWKVKSEKKIIDEEGGCFWDKIKIDENESVAQLEELYTGMDEKVQRMKGGGVWWDNINIDDDNNKSIAELQELKTRVMTQKVQIIKLLPNQMSSADVDQKVLMSREDSSQTPLCLTNGIPLISSTNEMPSVANDASDQKLSMGGEDGSQAPFYSANDFDWYLDDQKLSMGGRAPLYSANDFNWGTKYLDDSKGVNEMFNNFY